MCLNLNNQAIIINNKMDHPKADDVQGKPTAISNFGLSRTVARDSSISQMMSLSTAAKNSKCLNKKSDMKKQQPSQGGVSAFKTLGANSGRSLSTSTAATPTSATSAASEILMSSTASANFVHQGLPPQQDMVGRNAQVRIITLCIKNMLVSYIYHWSKSIYIVK